MWNVVGFFNKKKNIDILIDIIDMMMLEILKKKLFLVLVFKYGNIMYKNY